MTYDRAVRECGRSRNVLAIETLFSFRGGKVRFSAKGWDYITVEHLLESGFITIGPELHTHTIPT
jgi:hypothetical protein